MRKGIYISILMVLLSVGAAFGQSALTMKAFELYQKGEYVLASKTIGEAIQEKEGLNDPVAWQLRAIIYYEIYDKVEKKNTTSESRVTALGSALHSMELDVNKEFYDQNINLLERISVSYYNDAVVGSEPLRS